MRPPLPIPLFFRYSAREDQKENRKIDENTETSGYTGMLRLSDGLHRGNGLQVDVELPPLDLLVYERLSAGFTLGALWASAQGGKKSMRVITLAH